MNIDRRKFIQTVIGTSMTLPLAAASSSEKLQVGLIADVHKDIIHDADERLTAFIKAMKVEKVDAILQLGDFCIPKPANRGFVEIFDSFDGPRHHVIGNHDTDGGFTRDQAVAFWGMKKRYYSFDLDGFHFIILDSNHRPDGWKGGYPSHIEDAQVEWLDKDLAATSLNTFVFSHQSLERPTCIGNQEAVRAVLEKAKTPDGNRKVAACFNGHWHIDHQRVINGIPYIHINSASYLWVGGKNKRERLSPELSKKFPWVSSTIPYTCPLFTRLVIDPAAGTFSIVGCQSEWMGPGPDKDAIKDKGAGPESIQPRISKRAGSLSSS